MSVDNTTLLPIGKVELLNKEDDEGHHYLKIMLLSNRLNANKWQAPYEDIKQLPKQLLDSYTDLDGYPEHDNTKFLKLYNDLSKEGKSEDEIYQRFREESGLKSLGKVTKVFVDEATDKNVLFGEFKVTNKEWNKFIEENKRPPYGFTSPALLGTYDINDDGTLVYHMDTARAFHIGFVPNPAFPPEESKIRAVCHSKDQKCRLGIAFASSEPRAEPDKNLNTDTNNNTNIHMSNEQNTTTTGTILTQATSTAPPTTLTYTLTDGTSASTGGQWIPTTGLGGSGFDKDPKSIDDKIVNNTPTDNKVKKQEDLPKEKDTEAADERLAKLEEELKIARKEKEEQRNFILDKILLANIPRDNFKKDEEFEAERTAVKGLINKYNMSYDDSEWFVKKAYPKLPVNDDKKKGFQPNVASTIFAPSSITKNESQYQSTEQPKTFCPSNPLPVEF